jgi:hypothetical protein
MGVGRGRARPLLIYFRGYVSDITYFLLNFVFDELQAEKVVRKRLHITYY